PITQCPAAGQAYGSGGEDHRDTTSEDGMTLSRTVTDETFEAEVLSSPRPVIVAYRAQWCGPCRQLAPVLEAIAQERAGAVALVELAADETPRTARRFGILHVPTTAVFSGGGPVRQVVGAKSKSAMLRDLAGVL